MPCFIICTGVAVYSINSILIIFKKLLVSKVLVVVTILLLLIVLIVIMVACNSIYSINSCIYY